jgi:hypothetical protein
VVAVAISKVDVVLKAKSGTSNEKAEAKDDEKICKEGNGEEDRVLRHPYVQGTSRRDSTE